VITDPNKTEFTLNNSQTNKKLLFYIGPFVLLLSIPYLVFWNDNILENIKDILIAKVYITLPVIIAGIIIHELLHGMVWAVFVKGGIKSIKFGFSKNNFTPYCHCKVPIKLKYYICGGIMPALILGILPMIISWFNGNTAMFLFGVVFCLAAGSDILICLMLRRINPDIFIQDFHDKPGCYIVEDAKDTKG